MQPILVLIALVAGTFNAIEAGTNTALRKGLNAPIWWMAVISIETPAPVSHARHAITLTCVK